MSTTYGPPPAASYSSSSANLSGVASVGGSITINPSVVYGGGGGLSSYLNPAYSQALQYKRTTNLTTEQFELLMREHTFIGMGENTPFCLFCYALDQFRTESQHEHIIHEE